MIGNIKQKTYYAYTTGTPAGGTAITYGYDTVWKDKLTSYNGKAITYDAIGNPLTYDGWTYTWQAGRQLAKMQKTGMTVEFKYNHSGLRTQKKVTENGVTTTTDYTLHGKLITHLTKGNEALHFFYDAQSKPAMVEYNGAMYRYAHNLQGDIVGILDSAGTLVVEYKYDAWGNPISTTGSLKTSLGELNPFRYRGYVWDHEVGLFYLRNRYYCPDLCRFLNADSILRTQDDALGYNTFSYCDNNVINHRDEEGYVPQATVDSAIHNLVLEDICNDTRYTDMSWHGTCIYYNKKNIWGGWGFCDLYNVSTGEVWELKKDSNSRSCKTANAQKQLAKYLQGRLKKYPDLALTLPYSTIIYEKTISFTDKLDGYVYDIKYWSEGEGILRYSYTRSKTELRKNAESVINTIVSLCIFALFGYQNSTPVFAY